MVHEISTKDNLEAALDWASANARQILAYGYNYYDYIAQDVIALATITGQTTESIRVRFKPIF